MKQMRSLYSKSNTILWLAIILISGISYACARNKQLTGKTESKPILNVLDMGATGNGVNDDTRFFQKAIDSVASLGGGTVFVPKGNYMIDTDTQIKLKSHVTLHMVDSTAQLIAKPTKSGRYYMLMVLNVTDVNIIGGKLMGDRDHHLDTSGEWGMGIAVYSSTNVNINGTIIRNFWGDGIVIGAVARFNALTPSRFVTVKNVVSDNNRRQGITIGKANGVVIDSSVFTNTNGTKPMAGIDIEPDRDTAQNIKILNCVFAFNKGPGVEMYAHAANAAIPSAIINIVVKNNYIHHNSYGGYVIRAKNLDFTGNRIIQNKYGPPIKAVDTVNAVMIPNTYE